MQITVANENTEWKGGVLVEKGSDNVTNITWGNDEKAHEARDAKYAERVSKLQPDQLEVKHMASLSKLLRLFQSEHFLGHYCHYRAIALNKLHNASLKQYIDDENIFRSCNEVKYIPGQFCFISHLHNMLDMLRQERVMCETVIPGVHFIHSFKEVMEGILGAFVGEADKKCVNTIQESDNAVWIMLDVLHVWNSTKVCVFSSVVNKPSVVVLISPQFVFLVVLISPQ